MTEKTLSWKDRLKAIPSISRAHRFVADRLDVVRWRLAGRPVPPPHRIKQLCVLEYGRRYGIDTLVETGTYMGAMIQAVRRRFRLIYSIELSEELHKRAAERFHRQRHVRLLHGDSATMLPGIIEQLEGPVVFWLDAHYSGGVTGRAALDTPIVQEIETILGRNFAGDVILIDDARCFDGTCDYPRLEELQATIESRWPGWSFTVQNDIIRIAPLQDPARQTAFPGK